MRKTIHALALLLAVITLTISSQSCSGEPLPEPAETLEPGTRFYDPTGPIEMTGIMVADLTVTGNGSQILLEWDHLYNAPYDYIFIYRSETTPIIPMGSNTINTHPTIMIPMGTDPFCYTFNLFFDRLWSAPESYGPVYYQVTGVREEYVSGSRLPVYKMKWLSPEITNIELEGGIPWFSF